MYLVGARFGDLGSANAALVELRGSVEVAPSDLGLRQLGSLRYEQPVRGHVVAGRFASDDVAAVLEIMQRHGGEIVFRGGVADAARAVDLRRRVMRSLSAPHPPAYVTASNESNR